MRVKPKLPSRQSEHHLQFIWPIGRNDVEGKSEVLANNLCMYEASMAEDDEV
jgi:hypothetical protein